MEQTQFARPAGASLYSDVTAKIIAQIEEGRLPWAQPWDGSRSDVGVPRNAGTGRGYSGINILILWSRLFERGYESQRWLTFRQAQALGGRVRKGEAGTGICYVSTQSSLRGSEEPSAQFKPKDQEGDHTDGGTPRQIAFLKRFTVFNIDQCTGLPNDLTCVDDAWDDEETLVPRAHQLAQASGADLRVGGVMAYYAPDEDVIHVPRQALFDAPIDYYRTLLHELGHWTGHASRLDRFHRTAIDPQLWYAREELVAEMTSAFLCAELGIVPTVRHADYIGAWLSILREDNRAIFRAASQASKAAQFLLAFEQDHAGAVA